MANTTAAQNARQIRHQSGRRKLQNGGVLKVSRAREMIKNRKEEELRKAEEAVQRIKTKLEKERKAKDAAKQARWTAVLKDIVKKRKAGFTQWLNWVEQVESRKRQPLQIGCTILGSRFLFFEERMRGKSLVRETNVLEFRLGLDWWQFETRRKFIWRAWSTIDHSPSPDPRFENFLSTNFSELEIPSSSFLSLTSKDPIGVWKKQKDSGWEKWCDLMNSKPELERWLIKLRERAGEGRDILIEDQEQAKRQAATDKAMREESSSWENENSEEFQLEYQRILREEQTNWASENVEEETDVGRGIGDEDTWAEGEDIAAREGYSSDEDSDPESDSERD